MCLISFNSYKVWLKRSGIYAVNRCGCMFQFLQGLIKTVLQDTGDRIQHGFQFLQGLIKTNFIADLVAPQICFNSYKVWLKQKCGADKLYFSFRFNSYKVWLKHSNTWRREHIQQFQFLQGLIKTWSPDAATPCPKRFQFLQGLIKTCAHCFNTLEITVSIPTRSD